MEYNTQTIIKDVNVNWAAIRNACMTTIGKDGGDKEPTELWKKKILLCEHSPIRRGVISWVWPEIPYAISTHFARHHIGCEKFISTSRADRTDIKDRSQRSQMDYVRMEMEANIQALINISRKRLCGCADPVTRKYWMALLEEIAKIEPEIFWACVPECIATGGCPEYTGCGIFNNASKDWTKEDLTNVMKRYDLYNEQRAKTLKLNK